MSAKTFKIYDLTYATIILFMTELIFLSEHSDEGYKSFTLIRTNDDTLIYTGHIHGRKLELMAEYYGFGFEEIK